MSDSEQAKPAIITLDEAVDAFRTTQRLEKLLRQCGASPRAVSVLAYFAKRPDTAMHEGSCYFGHGANLVRESWNMVTSSSR